MLSLDPIFSTKTLLDYQKLFFSSIIPINVFRHWYYPNSCRLNWLQPGPTCIFHGAKEFFPFYPLSFFISMPHHWYGDLSPKHFFINWIVWFVTLLNFLLKVLALLQFLEFLLWCCVKPSQILISHKTAFDKPVSIYDK